MVVIRNLNFWGDHRDKTQSDQEDEFDARVADMALEEYEQFLASGGQEVSWEELMDDCEG